MTTLSLLTPSGHLTLGNLLGALRPMAEHQDDAFYGLSDLHAMTTAHDPALLRERTREMATLLLAAGLERATLFLQSRVPAHTELAYLLECTAHTGELNRMIQFKEKRGRDSTRVSLYTYPVLMAADILLYRPTRVPVGDDQRQHVELTRDVAERFNSRFGETFKLPEGVYPEVGARIMDLQEPTNKMSTTIGTEQGTVRLLDEPDVIRKKLRSAVTDSGSEVRRSPDKPGVTNLIDILSALTGEDPDAIEARYDGAGYGQFKTDVGEAVVEAVVPVQERYRELRADAGELQRLLAVGAEKAAEASAPTLAAMYERMGFVRLS
jgi:tryptophanyl-tRNA synthetase